MSVIAYDKPVRDFIEALNATGHVTHRSYNKQSVTIHHNAGRLTHEGVLNVWKVRPASAHFNVDREGTVAQFVKVNEYAWATGNTVGNQTSISIEMGNSDTQGVWPVAEVTWHEAARLAGWLFAKVIGARPSKNNLFYHHHWIATNCAGPYMDSVYDQVLALAQSAYDQFAGGNVPTSSPVVEAATKSLTQLAAEVWAGKWGNGADRTNRLTAAGYNAKAVQDLVNKGVGQPPAAPAAQTSRKSIVEIAKEVIAGSWGNGDDRRTRLAKAGYNPTSVQMEVNRQLAPTTRKSIDTLATEVIAGKWGNGPDRVRRLTAAGYSATQVQAEVNRRL